MTRALVTLTLMIASLQGCVYYENNGDATFTGDDGSGGESWWDDLDNSDTGADEVAESSGLVITPDRASAGDTLLITLSATVEFDFSVVTEVHFDGPVTVQDVSVRDGEVLIVITIDANAAPGDIAVWVEGEGGEVWTCDTALTIEAPAGDHDTDCE